MKKAVTLMLALAMMFITAGPAMAMYGPVEKLTSGVVKIVKSPLIIFSHTKSEMDDHLSTPVGFTKGLVESPFYMLKDIGGGLVDILTFPLD
ncbi:MAG: hypothetical protein KC900_14840 [Candidatus Omnitrophica bacterium]|nr:hypothetical protein [Candidatus Omnitrophota bacterium]